MLLFTIGGTVGIVKFVIDVLLFVVVVVALVVVALVTLVVVVGGGVVGVGDVGGIVAVVALVVVGTVAVIVTFCCAYASVTNTDSNAVNSKPVILSENFPIFLCLTPFLLSFLPLTLSLFDRASSPQLVVRRSKLVVTIYVYF